MDIPGLNESNNSYIENIFSLFNPNDILFEIMIFDSNSFKSNSVLKIINQLEKKKCLKKEKNIFILNKIDLCEEKKDKVISQFKQHFYQTYEDDKNQDSLKININNNYFIPINSLLLGSEIKADNDFTSFLLLELFNYIELNNGDITTFFTYLKKKLKTLISRGELNQNDISLKLSDNDISIILNGIQKINEEMIPKISKGINLGKEFKDINSNNINIKLQKIYNAHKLKKYIFDKSDTLNILKKIINNVNIENEDLNNRRNNNNNIILLEKKKNVDGKNSDLIEELLNFNKFIKKCFKLIDEEKEMPLFKNKLEDIKESILGRKIRIAFIGNMNVGKSTVLNSIIGHELLPIDCTECTRRGVILRHKNIENFELYKTKLVIKGIGEDQYSFFQDAERPYCKGINEIKSYLNNKNNDDKIEDNDAYIVITGKLKIFEFIHLEDNLINIIEFIDLPGHDNEKNNFNKKKYYKEILQFTNCCIYINDPTTIEDDLSVTRIVNQYCNDKNKLISSIQSKFIKTCLFLINKADELSNEKEKEKISNKIIEKLKINEKNITKENINISFFSGKSFNEYLNSYNKFIDIIESNPSKLIKLYFLDYHKNIKYKNFQKYFNKQIAEKIEEQFNLDLNIEEKIIQVPEEFQNKLRKAFECLNYKFIKKEEEDIIIKKIFLINQQLKTKNFNNTKYSHSFFDNLKISIMSTEKLQNEKFKDLINGFFINSDLLFNKEIKEEYVQLIKDNKEKLKYIQKEIIFKLKNLFEEKISKIKKSIQDEKKNCLELIDDEINNISKRLKDFNNSVRKAAKKLEDKLKNIIKDIDDFIQKELKSLFEESEKIFKEANNEFEINNDLKTKINSGLGIYQKMMISLFSSTFLGFGSRYGLTLLGEAILTSVGTVGGEWLLQV